MALADICIIYHFVSLLFRECWFVGLPDLIACCNIAQYLLIKCLFALQHCMCHVHSG